MKGLVFSQFTDMVEERFGPDLLERIISSCNLPSGGVYSSLGTYDFEEMAALVMAPFIPIMLTSSRANDAPRSAREREPRSRGL